jgi:putative ABC transport system permease protein
MASRRNRPPAVARWILERIFSDQGRRTHVSEFEEIFEEIRGRQGLSAARTWYRLHLLKSLPGFLSNRLYWSLSMFRNYLVISFRTILKNKWFSLINLAGLAVGLAGVIMIAAYVRFELSYDRFHEKADRIFRVLTFEDPGKNKAPEYESSSPDLLAPALASDIPEIVRATRVAGHFGDDAILHSGESSFKESGLFVDAEFLKVFSFPLFRGDRATALTEAGSIVLSDRVARKLFGSADPIGKPIRFLKADDDVALTVRGVVANTPLNSHLKFDFLISLETLRADPKNKYMFSNWGVFNFTTYMELHDATDKTAVEAKFPALAEKRIAAADRFRMALQPLGDIHLRSRIQGQLTTNDEIRYVRLFAAIALVLLLIAVINYVNLATSRSSTRSKEIGIRKVTGANRGQLFRQFLGESLTMTVAALILALALVRILWPRFTRLVGVDLDFRILWNPEFLAAIAGTALAVGVLAGLHPALILSNLHPVRALREFGGSGRKGARLRSTLVVVQLGASVILLTGTIVIGRQMEFIRTQNPGYDREQVLLLPLREKGTQSQGLALREDFLKNPAVLGVSVSSCVPAEILNRLGVSLETEEGPKVKSRIAFDYIDESFLGLYKIGLLQGRNIKAGEKNVALVNESLVRTLGWKNPLDKTIPFLRENAAVVGVVRDFHYATLHSKIAPLALVPIDIFGRRGDTIAVRIRPGDFVKTLAALRTDFEKRAPRQPFEVAFFDEVFDALYKKESRTGEFFRVFAILTVFIACLGLAGLTAFAVERRTKEIGIRKVLGASGPRLTALLNRQILALVLLADVIALPLAYGVMSRWLRDFAYKIDFTVWILLSAAAAAAALALATTGFQTVRAARKNPVDSLRFE